jgi:hypothetical protein
LKRYFIVVANKQMAFQAQQTTGNEFRAQVVKGASTTLWVAESDESIYTVCFDKILAADVYQSKADLPAAVILLFEIDEEVESIDIGAFTRQDAVQFLSWLQSTLKS